MAIQHSHAKLGECDQRLVDSAVKSARAVLSEDEQYENFCRLIGSVEMKARSLDPQAASRVRSAGLWDLNKLINDPILRQKIADKISRSTIENVDGLGLSHAAIRKSRGALESVGLKFMDCSLTAQELDEVRSFFSGTLQPESCNDGLINFHIHDVVRAPHLIRTAVSAPILEAVSNFLGAPATIMNLSAWISNPGGELQGAQIFHRDRADFRACKLFIYLSDVNADTGPHIFIKHSHRLEEIYRRLPQDPAIRDVAMANLFIGNGRRVQDLIQQYLGRDIIEITGRAGTAFLEANYGYHRGKEPVTGSRLLFQVLYGLLPYPHNIDRLTQSGLTDLPADVPDTMDARHALRFAMPT